MGRVPTLPTLRKINMVTGTAVGVTSFVLGREQDANREVRTFEDGQEYDTSLTQDMVQGYTADAATFPYPA